jgi:hypothetical protein
MSWSLIIACLDVEEIIKNTLKQIVIKTVDSHT